MMKLTFENQHGIFSIELKDGNESLSHIAEFMIEPLFLAAGYSQQAIDNFLWGEDDDKS